MKASVSRIKCFKACRKKYFFQYHEGLTPVESPAALETGKSYHKLIETIAGGGVMEPDYSKEAAMAIAFEKHILPKLPKFTPEVELFKAEGAHILHGIVDGLTEDGEVVEHKTTSLNISEGGEYEYNLLWDEQVLAYMELTGARKVHYTVVKKPTIRLKKDETEQEFFERMLAWYEEDTESKCRAFTVERTDEEVADFVQSFIEICDKMEKCEGRDFYRNCMNCNAFNRRCEYSSICLNYDPAQEYVDFTKKGDCGNESN